MPADFSTMGKHGQVYISGQKFPPLQFVEPGEFYAMRVNNGSATSQYPTHWTMGDKTALGRSTIQVFPGVTSSVTLDIRGYVKRLPDLIDRPMAPTTVDSGVAGSPNGAYQYKVTFVTALGETETSAASTSLTVSSKKITVTVPVSTSRAVTSRNVYRTVASGTAFKLLTAIADNTTTSYLDNIADGSLTTAAPDISAAVTGFEVFPEGMQDTVLIEGLVARFEKGQDDKKAPQSDVDFEKAIKRAWNEYAQGQDVSLTLPAFGAQSYVGAGRSFRSRLQGI
jgi:hypothetical protein